MTPSRSLNRICGVYSAIHRELGLIYVGSSKNIGVRLNAHLGSTRRGSKSRFHSALRLFGPDEFDIEVLEECKEDELLEREQFYISFLGSAHGDNLNVMNKAHSVYGVHPSESTKDRYRAAKLGKKLSEEHKAKLRSAVRKSKKSLTPEHRAKLSEAHKKSPKCIAHWTAIHKARRGTKQSPETIEKKRKSLLGGKRTQEQRARISASLKGRKMSEEAKRNMSLGWVKWRERKEFREKNSSPVLCLDDRHDHNNNSITA